jgi:tripartite-type tricarboxylate transporter receptor subunit TctC
MAPPGTPKDRVEALRNAIKVTFGDPQFQAETKTINLEIQPLAPEAIEKIVGDIFRTPQPVLERARVLLSVGNR